MDLHGFTVCGNLYGFAMSGWFPQCSILGIIDDGGMFPRQRSVALGFFGLLAAKREPRALLTQVQHAQLAVLGW